MDLNATLIIEVLSFLILVGLLVKFLYRPLLHILDKRAEEIKQAHAKIEENLTSAREEREKAEQFLAQTKIEALKMKEGASRDAELMRQKIINQAKEETRRIFSAGQEEIVNETKKAKEKIKDKVIDLSLQVAEKILRREFSARDQRRLIRELTEGIDDGRGASGR